MKKLLFLLPLVLPMLLHAQMISTVAGKGGVSGDTGDGGPATAATLVSPQGIARDKSGNLYITNHDHTNHHIRKIDAAGIYTIFAGAGPGGYSGDGGPATAALMDDPLGMCADKYGNIYVAEEINSVIRKINTSGIITTVAGNGTPGYGGDGGPATAAQLNSPQSVKVDTAGNIYITDRGNYVVRKVNTSGIITTFAGNNTVGYSGDGGPATAAQMEWPADVAIDSAGNIFISDYTHHVIRKVGKNDTITTAVGLPSGGFAGDGGPATASRLWAPWGIEFDSSWNLLIVDTRNNRIRKVTPSGIISTVAGDGTNSHSLPGGAFGGDGGLATAAQMYWPAHVAIGAAGSFYISDQSNYAIRMVDTIKPKDPLAVTRLNATGSSITIQPNPNKGSFVITGAINSTTEELVTAEVRNILGQVVHRERIAVNKGAIHAPLNLGQTLPAGMYTLLIRSELQYATVYFVIND